MRWFWIDRFLEFESGKRAVTVKGVSLSEEHLHDHIPGVPVMPASLMIEGMAQTGGILLGESSGFNRLVVLAKVPKMVFHGFAVPGDTIRYDVTLMQETPDGGIVETKAWLGETLLAEGEICFAFVEDTSGSLTGSNGTKTMLADAGLVSVLSIGQVQTTL